MSADGKQRERADVKPKRRVDEHPPEHAAGEPLDRVDGKPWEHAETARQTRAESNPRRREKAGAEAGGVKNGINGNTGRRAVALKYDSERGAAPLITAVGKGRVADRIIEVADQSGIARVEDEFQANALSAFDAGARVPKFLYDLVAEVLLFIEDADARNQRRYG